MRAQHTATCKKQQMKKTLSVIWKHLYSKVRKHNHKIFACSSCAHHVHLHNLAFVLSACVFCANEKVKWKVKSSGSLSLTVTCLYPQSNYHTFLVLQDLKFNQSLNSPTTVINIDWTKWLYFVSFAVFLPPHTAWGVLMRCSCTSYVIDDFQKVFKW